MSHQDWPQYLSHKVVRAMPITEITNDGVIRLWTDAAPGRPVGRIAFEPTERAMKARARVGDYAMSYPDGYLSVCPKEQFDNGYSKLDK